MKRLQIKIKGQVQGVGFRPCIYQIAETLQLTGFVQNNALGVVIEIQGQQYSHFLPLLKKKLPALTRIDAIHTQELDLKTDEQTFQIASSVHGKAQTIISPDVSICEACLADLFDPKSHYYRFPFINCTQCGPRFSIVRRLPYDRNQTSMNVFPLCPACHEDYSNPGHRRYHAQPTACTQCGPTLSTSIQEIIDHLLQGDIIAIKGLGGYQLICDAKNEKTITRLRKRKTREAKPFAIMVANIPSAEQWVKVSPVERKILTSPERPIVLLKRNSAALPDNIAPGLSHLGLMLPYTPLHYLLFNAFAGFPNGCEWLEQLQTTVLIVTSANLSGNPLLIEDDQASDELKGIADRIVSYNRKIISRVDDSVLRVTDDLPLFIRRARGYVPTRIKLCRTLPSTLALGAHLKNTFCVTRGDEAFVSQHIGTLDNKPSIDFLQETLAHFLKFLDLQPERVAHDLHPDFYTTHLAQTYGLPTFAIQHHHAHLAAVAAEHQIQEPALGLALDGYGYGSDAKAWGGELLLLDNTTFERLGSFYPIPLPGGDLAVRQPWRTGAGILHLLGKGHEISERFSNQAQVDHLPYLLEKKLNCPLTSSCGRLFDGLSALLGLTMTSQYEGQAAMRLESLVTTPQVLRDGWQIDKHHFNLLPAISKLLEQDPQTAANFFHGTLIAGLSEWLAYWAGQLSIHVIVLSGGCFLNECLASGLVKALSCQGLKPLLPRQLPPNDGGLALGQAWIAGNS